MQNNAHSQKNQSTDILVQEWFRRARRNQRIHYQCAEHFNKKNKLLGIPAIVISTLVGSAVFASIEHEASGAMKIVLGLLSIGAAVLASLQTFLSYSERAERHRITSARYASVRRQLELLAGNEYLPSSEIDNRLVAVQQALDSCAESAPHVPQAIEHRVTHEFDDTRKVTGKQLINPPNPREKANSECSKRTHTGTISKKFENGYGYIQKDGKEFFFHSNEVIGISFEELRVGDTVTFSITESPDGLVAVDVARA